MPPTREKNRLNVKSAKTANYVCANCCCSVSGNKKEDFVTQINLSLNYNAPKQPIQVATILSTIFKLELVQLFHGNLLPTDEKIGVCLSCATILGNLYQFYSYFVEIRRSDSLLSTQIELLDQLLMQFQQTWSEMNHNSTNSNTVIEKQQDCRNNPVQEKYTRNVNVTDQKVIPKVTNNLQNISRSSSNKNSSRSNPLCESRSGPWILLTRLTPSEIADAVIKKPTLDEEIVSTAGEVGSTAGYLFSDETSNFEDDQEIDWYGGGDDDSMVVGEEIVIPINSNKGREIKANCIQFNSSKKETIMMKEEENNANFSRVPKSSPDDDDDSNNDDDSNHDDNDEDYNEEEEEDAVGEGGPDKRKGKKRRTLTESKGDGKYLYRNWEFEFVSEKCYRCSTCNLATETMHAIKQHIRKKHCTGTHPCEKCSRSFLSLKGLTNHTCESRDPNSKPKRIFQFSIDCGEGKFLYRGQWPFHIVPGENGDSNENVKKKEFQCGICNTIRRGRNSIAAHIRIIHAEANDYICEFCGKQTANKKAYDSHMQNHSDTPLICDVCGKQFKLRQSLHEHKMAHEKRTYKCEVEGCDKVLTTRGGLYFHRQTHKSGGVQSHECPHCHKRFMQKHGLKLHVSKNCPKNRPVQDKIDDDEDMQKDRYYCDFEGCNKVLTTQGGLYFHKKTHECGGVKQHECPNCHRLYMQKHGLKLHMAKYCKKVSNDGFDNEESSEASESFQHWRE